MIIKPYTQGSNAAADRELFGLVGRWLTDKAVNDELGASITTRDGDLWRIAMGSRGRPSGFATGRVSKSGGMHLRFVFCVDGDEAACRKLIQCVTKHALDAGCNCIWTNDRWNALRWKPAGFTATPRGRGTFVRWEKPLGDAS